MKTKTKTSRWTEARMPYKHHCRIFASTLAWGQGRFGDTAGEAFASLDEAIAALAAVYGPVSVTRTSAGALGQAIAHSTDLATPGGLHVQILEYPEILERRESGEGRPEYRIPGFRPTHATA